ncbi:hypothetical protein [Phocaeicola sp.]
MAKKEQCQLCEEYKPELELCTIKWVQLSFDGNECEQFDNIVSLEQVKQLEVENEKEANESSLPKADKHIKKRSVTPDKSTIHIEETASSVSPQSKENPKKFHYKPLSKTSKSVLLFITLIIIIIGTWQTYTFIKESLEKKEREKNVWLAICELEDLRVDKTVRYLRLNDIKYEDKKLKLGYHANYSTREISRIVKDSLMYDDFLSVIAIAPQKWNIISHYLAAAEVDLYITYFNTSIPSYLLSWKQLSTLMSDKQKLRKGKRLFVNRKKEEVLNYALKHFGKDRYFKVDSLSLDNKYVSLHMYYDKSIASLGETFLDTIHVNPPYTDKVGDMGSLLDGMLAICSRINRGFAFVYFDRKERKVQRCEWNVEKAKAIAKQATDKVVLVAIKPIKYIRL